MQKPTQGIEKINEKIAENKLASEAIISELAQEGFQLEWIADLFNKQLNYSTVIPILLKWLPLVDNPNVKEDIVRALSVPWARNSNAQILLVEEFRKSTDELGLKWAIGNALSVIADDEVFFDIINFIQNNEHGKAREMLVVALGNMKAPEVVDFLVDLLEDEELAGHSIIALGKLKPKKARTAIEPFLSHPKSWIRNEAKKAINRIEK